jgi:hypothetical protein
MVMGKVVLDADLRAKFNGLNEPMDVVDESGRVVGLFVPTDQDKARYANLTIPYSEEEIERRLHEEGGCTLDEIWKKLGVK